MRQLRRIAGSYDLHTRHEVIYLLMLFRTQTNQTHVLFKARYCRRSRDRYNDRHPFRSALTQHPRNCQLASRVPPRSCKSLKLLSKTQVLGEIFNTKAREGLQYGCQIIAAAQSARLETTSEWRVGDYGDVELGARLDHAVGEDVWCEEGEFDFYTGYGRDLGGAADGCAADF
jgi:hypothetical protein